MLLRRVLSSFSARAMSSILSPGAGWPLPRSGPPSLSAPSTQSVIWRLTRDVTDSSQLSPGCIFMLTGDVSCRVQGEKISLDCDTGDENITVRAWLSDCEPPAVAALGSVSASGCGPGPGRVSSVCCYYCGQREPRVSAASQHPVSEIWKERFTIAELER